MTDDSDYKMTIDLRVCAVICIVTLMCLVKTTFVIFFRCCRCDILQQRRRSL